MYKLPVIGVMGSGTVAHSNLSVPLGRSLAQLDVHLLTGGGSGVMEAVSEAFYSAGNRKGRVIGVLPSASADPKLTKEGYPNKWIEIVIRTHLPLSGDLGTSSLSRNHINVLSSDVVIVLPGGSGTRSEAQLAQDYDRPVIGFYHKLSCPGWFNELPLKTFLLEEVEAFVVDKLEKLEC